jgi:acyl-coenzyme A thioesterase PaaI-like protein
LGRWLRTPLVGRACLDGIERDDLVAMTMDASRQPSIFDSFEAPPSAKLLGWTLRAIDPDAGTIEVGFAADERFINPAGTIQGGIVAKGRVVNIGRTIAFTEAEPFDEDGDLVARSTIANRAMRGDKANGRL